MSEKITTFLENEKWWKWLISNIQTREDYRILGYNFQKKESWVSSEISDDVKNIMNKEIIYNDIIKLIDLWLKGSDILYLVKIFDIKDEKFEKIFKKVWKNIFWISDIWKILNKYKNIWEEELIKSLFFEQKKEYSATKTEKNIVNESELRENIDNILLDTNNYYKCTFELSIELQEEIIWQFVIINWNLNYLENLLDREITEKEFNIIINHFSLKLEKNMRNKEFYVNLLHKFDTYDLVLYLQKFYNWINKDIIDKIYNNIELYIQNSYNNTINIYLKFALAIWKEPNLKMLTEKLKNSKN